MRIFWRSLLIILIIELSLRFLGSAYYFIRVYKPNKNDRDKIRILCLGESTTFGVCVVKGQDYPAQLELLLNKKYPGKFAVYNRGVPAINSSLILFNIRRSFDLTKPGLLILCCGANEGSRLSSFSDSLILLPGENNVALKKAVLGLSRFLYNLRIYRLLAWIRDNMRNGFFILMDTYVNNYTCPRADFTPPEVKIIQALVIEQYHFNMREITKFFRDRGTDVVYTTYLKHNNSDLIRDAAVKNKVILCDQEKMFPQGNITIDSVISQDGFHPDAAGHKIMAESLFKTLEDQGVLSRLLRQKYGERDK